eukprot:352957-Chlamydomonas_euryale.AAC.2
MHARVDSHATCGGWEPGAGPHLKPRNSCPSNRRGGRRAPPWAPGAGLHAAADGMRRTGSQPENPYKFKCRPLSPCNGASVPATHAHMYACMLPARSSNLSKGLNHACTC